MANVIEMDFAFDLKEAVIQSFLDNGFSIANECLTKYDAMQFLILCFDYFNQAISNEPKTVLYSQELEQKLDLLPNNVKFGLNKLHNMIEAGEDVSRLQSRKRTKKITLHTNYSKNDFQYQLYGITHFRLPIQNNASYLLFALFKNNIAYFIDISEHSKACWFTRHLLVVIENNWMDLISIYKLPEGTKMCTPISDEGIKVLAKKGISTFIETKNGIYMPPGMGFQVNGSSTKSIRNAMQLHNEAIRCELFLKENLNIVKDMIIKLCNISVIELPNPMEFRYLYVNINDSYDYVAVEKNTGVYYAHKSNKWGTLLLNDSLKHVLQSGITLKDREIENKFH